MRRRVDGDLGAHRSSVGWRRASSGVAAREPRTRSRLAERPARGRQRRPSRRRCGIGMACQTPGRSAAMLAVDRQQLAVPQQRHRRRDHLARRHQAFLVRQRQPSRRAGARRRASAPAPPRPRWPAMHAGRTWARPRPPSISAAGPAARPWCPVPASAAFSAAVACVASPMTASSGLNSRASLMSSSRFACAVRAFTVKRPGCWRMMESALWPIEPVQPRMVRHLRRVVRDRRRRAAA